MNTSTLKIIMRIAPIQNKEIAMSLLSFLDGADGNSFCGYCKRWLPWSAHSQRYFRKTAAVAIRHNSLLVGTTSS